MSKKKGDRRENQAKNILQNALYSVETPNSTPYKQPHGVDFFGAFDFLAISSPEFDGDRKPILGQVKSNGFRGIREFPRKCKDIGITFDRFRVQYWSCHDGEGWRIAEIRDTGHQVVYDERNESVNMGDGVESYLKSLGDN